MKIPVAKIALAHATYLIDKPYSYLIPQELAQKLAAGMRVIVPFGRGNRKSEGIVLRILEEEPSGRMKYIATLLDETPVLGRESLKLALWMRERYFCTVYDAARSMLPSGLYYRFKERFVLEQGVDAERAYETAEGNRDARRIVEMVVATPHGAERSDIYEAFGTKSPFAALELLIGQGILRTESELHRKTKDKSEITVSLAVSPEAAMEAVEVKRKTAPLRYAVMEQLVNLGSCIAKELCYFTGASMPTIRSLEKSGLVRLEKYEVFRRPQLTTAPNAEPIVLNAEQQAAYNGLYALCRSEQPEAALLYGITGSGKTQVYLSLIRSVLDAGKTAMVLVPEIVLTPQILQIFTAHFSSDVAVLHSSLRETERYDEWKRVRNGDARVVIGTRSAVFAPLENLGLIIMDEEQEASYKSSEQTPRYHTRDVAKFRVNQHKALLLMGSATPTVESFFKAECGVYHMFRLRHRYNDQSLPKVIIADMREELKRGNSGSIGAQLRQELEENIARGEQSILLINRRGASRMVSCAACGEVPECPHCSVKLTYHSANARLMCHYCGHSVRFSKTCGSCDGPLIFLGTGTQRVEEELKAHFPSVDILRMDTDTISAKQSHEAILYKFEQSKTPILLGTQMVAKGLDFANVTLVGVIAADLSLYVDDYRAGERTFSLLTQVVGRAGRGDKVGRAVIQTMTPENAVVTCAAVQDYEHFYQRELLLRELRQAPPYRDLFVLTAMGTEEMKVHSACVKLKRTVEQWVRENALDLQVFGPAPAAVMKVNNRFRYRLILSGRNDKQSRVVVAGLLRLAAEDKDNRGVHVFVDCNPMD